MPRRIDGSSSTTKTDLRVATMLLYPGFNNLLHCAPILGTLSQSLHIVLTCRVMRDPNSVAEHHPLESRLGSSMPSRSAFETSSASECTRIFSITWWR